MAVHVVQGRDPWWAPLAVNILGGLWNEWQQREKNKKEAAYLGELAKMYNGMQDGQNDTAPAPAQDTGQGLLNTNMAVPDEYNADGGANTFHKTDTPLTQFDLDTAGLAPTAPTTVATTAPINAWANALGNSGNTLTQFDTNTAGIVPSTAQTPVTATAQPVRAPIMTPMDFYRAALELAGTKRFRMLNPDRVQAMLTPYMKLNEEARQEQMRQDAADRYMNAGNDTDKLNQLYASTILGVTPQALLTSGQERYKYDNPYLQQYAQNTGAITRYGTFDPRRGTFNQAGEFENELTPQQQLDHQFRMLQHEAQQAQLREQMNYNYASLKQQGDLERARLDVENNSVSQIFTGNDGYQYVITKGGSQRKATDVPGLTAVQRSIIEMNEGRIKEIRSQREQLQKSRNTYVNKGQSDSPDVAEIDRQLSELDKREKQYQNKIYEILQSVPTGQQGQQRQTRQSTEQYLPPVAPPVNKYISQQEYDSYLREAEKGTLTAKGTPIRNRQELDDYLRSKGYAVLGNSRETTPAMPQIESPDVPVLESGDISPDIPVNNTSTDITNASANNSSIGDFFNIFGATPAYADENISSNNTTLAADTNTEAGIQNALEALNGQFGEHRWTDWASGLDLRGLGNRVTNLQSTNPNKPIEILGVPLVYPNGQINRYAPMGSRDLLDRDLRSPEEKFRDIVPIPNASLDAPNNEGFQLLSNRRSRRQTRPQRTYSGYYSGDTRNGGQYSSIINRHAKNNNVDPDLIAAIIQQESGGNSRAISDAGAQGLMQLMPQTARGLGVTDVFDPEQNIAGGTKYIAQMLKRYNGNIEKALWAYNAGPGNADKGNLPDETKKYIPSVMARYRRLKGIATNSPSTTKRTTRRRRTKNRRRR